MSDFTRAFIKSCAAENIAAAIRGESLEGFNVAQGIIDAVDENGYYAPDVMYSADAFEIVSGCEFNDITIDTPDFSGCEGSLHCLHQEANEIVRVAYDQDVQELAQSVADLAENMVYEMESNAGMAAEGVTAVSEFRLGGIPHDLEFDVSSDMHTVSVLVWKENRIAAFRLDGIFVECDLVDAEEE